MTNETLGRSLKEKIIKTGLTQRQFSKKHGFPPTSLSLWITGKRIPSKNKIKDLANALKTEGINFSDDSLFQEKPVDNVLDILKEISAFKNLYKGFSVFMMSDDSMAPRFLSRDCIGGIPILASKEFDNMLCLLETMDGYRGVRLLSYNKALNLYDARPLNNKFKEMRIKKENLQNVYKVFWCRMI